MVKKIAKIVQGVIRPAKHQYDWLHANEGDHVIIEDKEGKHGPYLAIYKPTTEEDLELLKDIHGE